MKYLISAGVTILLIAAVVFVPWLSGLFAARYGMKSSGITGTYLNGLIVLLALLVAFAVLLRLYIFVHKTLYPDED